MKGLTVDFKFPTFNLPNLLHNFRPSKSSEIDTFYESCITLDCRDHADIWNTFSQHVLSWKSNIKETLLKREGHPLLLMLVSRTGIILRSPFFGLLDMGAAKLIIYSYFRNYRSLQTAWDVKTFYRLTTRRDITSTSIFWVNHQLPRGSLVTSVRYLRPWYSNGGCIYRKCQVLYYGLGYY